MNGNSAILGKVLWNSVMVAVALGSVYAMLWVILDF